VGRLKKEIKKSFLKEEFVSDSEMLKKAQKVLSTLESYKSKKPDKIMVEEVMKIQGLLQEINTNAH